MPGTFHVPRRAHVCGGMGSPSVHAPATQFHCSECPKKWVVVSGAQYNETYYAWRELTARNKDGRDVF